MSLFAELITDKEAIAAFVTRQNARTDADLTDAARQADEAAIRAILERPDSLRGLARREGFIYTFRQTPENPRGLWLRLPQEIAPTPKADWAVAFDLDAFCQAEGAVWVWRGAVTSALAPGRVLLRLSAEGSDMTRHIEFDLASCAIVDGGFDLPAGRGSFAWAGPDELLWSSAEGGDATQAGWSGTLRRLKRGQSPDQAIEVFRAQPEHLLCAGWFQKGYGDEVIEARMVMTAIGKSQITLIRPNGVFDLPNPPDTEVTFNASHSAWIAQAEGEHPAGSLVLAAHDGAKRVLFTPSDGLAVSDPSFSGDYLLWLQSEWLSPRLMALDLRDPMAQPQEIKPPVAAETISFGSYDVDPDAGDGTLVLYLAGFLTPAQQWLFDLSKGIEGISFRPLYAAPSEFDTQGCEVRLYKATSADGTQVPYHIVLPKERPAHGLRVLQYGYGGFGVALSPYYDAITGKCWIEKGHAYVMAYIRGGAELGPEWHLQAKGAGRHKAFEDFAAIAQDLVKRGLSRPELIACHGGSNGGLLCGVMLTQYAQHFGAIWASVGVQDMLGFADFPAGRGWMDEYGDPSRPEEAAWLRSYSPLHNIPKLALDAPLPAALIDTSHRDDRVDPSHSRRFAAALLAAGHQPWFYEHQGGHGGGGASTEKAAEQALGFAFLRKALGAF